MKYEVFLNPTRSEYKYVSEISKSAIDVESVRGVFSEGNIWIWRSDVLHNKLVKDMKLNNSIYFTIEENISQFLYGLELYMIANTSFMSPSFFEEVVADQKIFRTIAKRVRRFAPIRYVKYSIEGHKGDQFKI